MPRNVSGTYTLPLPPVVPNTVILSAWANSTTEDIAQAITNSLDRGGSGGMTAPFRLVDGSEGIPAFAFNAETGTGLWRNGDGVMAVSIQGDMVGFWSALGYTGAITGTLTGDISFSGTVAFNGAVAFNNDTVFNNPATFEFPVVINDSLTVDTQINCDTLNCTDDAFFGSLVTVNGAATFNDPVGFTDLVEFVSPVVFDGTVTIAGVLTCDTIVASDRISAGGTAIRETQVFVGNGTFDMTDMTIDLSGVGGRLVLLTGDDASGVSFCAIYAVAMRTNGGTGATVAATGLIRSGSASPTFAWGASGAGVVQLTVSGSSALTVATSFGA